MNIHSNSSTTHAKHLQLSACVENKPKSSLEDRMTKAFESKNLYFEKIPKSFNQFICRDGSFDHIKSAIDTFPKEEQKHLGRFFYCPERKAICCNLNKAYHLISLPSDGDWTFLLNASKKTETEETPPLTLSQGKECSEKMFIENPLFASSLEKHSVFKHLCKLQKTKQFSNDYQQFLETIQSSAVEWAETYRDKPFDLAYLSLFAYLDEKITKEKLFIVHMICSAFLESPDSAQYTVLTQENIREHLKNHNYLNETNENSDFHFLKNLDKKSLIERTTISYTSRPNDFRIDYLFYKTAEEQGFTLPGIIPLTKKENSLEAKPDVSILLLPPWISKRLYSELFPSKSPPIDHEEFFGYRTKLNDLALGRPISYASPLFYIPAIHGAIHGTQLGITAHDILFHCFLDWQHDHVQDIIQLGQELRAFAEKSKISEEKKTILKIVSYILDRAVDISSQDPTKRIAIFLNQVIEAYSRRTFSSAFFMHLIRCCKTIFPPEAISLLGEINTWWRENHEKDLIEEENIEQMHHQFFSIRS